MYVNICIFSSVAVSVGLLCMQNLLHVVLNDGPGIMCVCVYVCVCVSECVNICMHKYVVSSGLKRFTWGHALSSSLKCPLHCLKWQGRCRVSGRSAGGNATGAPSFEGQAKRASEGRQTKPRCRHMRHFHPPSSTPIRPSPPPPTHPPNHVRRDVGSVARR